MTHVTPQPEFRRAVTDPDDFGSAKALVNAMLADGVDLTDQAAVGSWIGAVNARPFEVRDEFLGGRSPLDPPDDRNRDQRAGTPMGRPNAPRAAATCHARCHRGPDR